MKREKKFRKGARLNSSSALLCWIGQTASFQANCHVAGFGTIRIHAARHLAAQCVADRRLWGGDAWSVAVGEAWGTLHLRCVAYAPNRTQSRLYGRLASIAPAATAAIRPSSFSNLASSYVT